MPTTVYRQRRVQRTWRNYNCGAGFVFADNYFGFAPPFVPGNYAREYTVGAVAFDISNGNQWAYYNGTWNQVTSTIGTVGITQGTINPSGSPVGNEGIYYNNLTGSLWIWNSRLQEWDQLTG